MAAWGGRDPATHLRRQQTINAEGGGRRAEEHHLRSESTNPVHGELHPVDDLVIQGILVGKL